MKKALLILTIILMASLGWAADYTITTTPEQETALKAIVDRINGPNLSPLGGEVQPKIPMTNADYLKARVSDLLNKYVDQEAKIAKDKVVEAIKQVSTEEATTLLKYQKASPAIKTTVDNALKNVVTTELTVEPTKPIK